MSAARMQRRTATIAMLVLGAWCAGCARTVHVGSDHTLQVALSEYRINPSSATVGSGFVTLIVRNYGRMTHNLVVADDGRPEGATKSIPPGTEATLYLELKPGSYTLSSSLLSGSDLGLRATLKVT